MARQRTRPGSPGTDVLTALQAAFAREYIVDFNGTRAAVRAGYTPTNASAVASRLLIKPAVADAVAAAIAAQQTRTAVTADRVLEDIEFAATLDPTVLFDHLLAMRPFREIPIAIRRCIQAITIVEKDGGRRIEVKFVNKSKMHELLARHVGIYQGEGAPVAPPPVAFQLPPGSAGVPTHRVQ